jgi:competence protein ComEC
VRPWVLPAVAASFGAGILAADLTAVGRAGLTGGAAVLLAGVAVLAAGGMVSSRRGMRSGELLLGAGLLEPPAEGPRERVLRAAGIPFGRPSGASRRSPKVAAIRAGALVVGVSLLGAGWASVRATAGPQLGSIAGRYVRFHGVAASDVRRLDFGWGLEATIRSAPPGGTERGVEARAWLSGEGPAPRIRAGEPLVGAGILEPVGPGATGFQDYLASRGVVATVEATDLRALGPATNPALRLANTVREGLRRGALASLPRAEAALLLGLSIGDTSSMDPEVERDFRATGLGHLVAVSGSNVAMFLAPILGAAVAVGARVRGRFLVGIVAVGFFALLTRWEPSVLRAGTMAALALGGLLAGRPRDTGALLGAAVLGLLVLDPDLAGSVGFQLSVAATAGLAAAAGPLASRLGWLPRPVALAAAATLAAQAAVTPLLLLRFGVVPTVTLLANLLAFPAVGLALSGGLSIAALGLVWPDLGRALGQVGRLPISYLIGLSDAAARLPLPAVTASGPMAPVAIGAAVVMAAWRLRSGRGPANRWVAGIAVAAAAWTAVPGAGPPSTLTVTFLDVGQGDAAVVRTPDGATVLVDAGPDEEQVAARLSALGVRRIDLAVATHAHADHIEGFPSVLSRFPVTLLIEPGCPGDSPSWGRFLEAVQDEGIPVRHPRGGQVLWVGRLEVRVLGPDRCSSGGTEPNDDSLVLRLRYEAATVLFTGDVEVPAQQDLLDDGDPVEAQVLKVPHHGGDTSVDGFLEAVDAEVAVVSTGPNDYGHPHPDVLEVLREASDVVLRTDRHGEVTVRFSRQGILVESAR